MVIWWKAVKSAGIGFFAQLVMGFFYGILISVFDLEMNIYVAYGMMFVSYLLAGFFGARKSNHPFTTACVTGVFLAFVSLGVTRNVFGTVLYPMVVPIGLGLTVGIACLGAYFYRLWVSYDRGGALPAGRERDESLEG